MPVTGLKVTFAFNTPYGGGMAGFSESLMNISNNPDDLKPKALDLAKKRLALCGNGVELVGLRIVDPTVQPHRGRLYPFNNVEGAGYEPIKAETVNGLAGVGRTMDRLPDQAQTAIQVLIYNANMQRKFIWLRAIPDGVTTSTDGPDWAGMDVWYTNYRNWRAAVQDPAQGWAFAARVNDGIGTPRPIQTSAGLSYQVLPGGTDMGILVNNADLPDAGHGLSLVQITRAAMVSRRLAAPNGIYAQSQVAVATDGTPRSWLYLRGLSARGFLPANVRFAGYWRLVDYYTAPITSVEIREQSSHKVGRPSLSPRGRSRSR